MHRIIIILTTLSTFFRQCALNSPSICKNAAGLHVGGLLIGPVHTHRWVRPGPTAQGVPSNWRSVTMHAWIRRLEKHWPQTRQYKWCRYNVTQYSFLPVPFPLGLHALPLGSPNRSCPQVELTSPFEKRVAQHTFIHAPSMGAAQH